MSKLERYAREIKEFLKELDFIKGRKEKFLSDLKRVKRADLKKFLKGKKKEERLKEFDNNTLKVLIKIEEINLTIADELVKKPSAGIPKVVSLSEKPEEVKKPSRMKISKKGKRKWLKEIDKEALRRVTKKEKPTTTRDVQYTVYSSAWYGRLSNHFFESMSLYLSKTYPEFFRNLTSSLMSSGLKILSKTYISLILFLSTLTFILVLLGGGVYSFLSKASIVLGLVTTISFSILAFVGMFLLLYFYPNMVAKMRRRAIKQDLPFVIIHMAAVAGSGAQPIAMFNLVLNSDEYPGLREEIKKIVNYVNLFGYDISTALKVVSTTTPSPEFKDLLTGIISNIQSGADLKSYLDGKATDALTTYKQERKKYTSTLSAYSDIYTGVLIAAPLLFMVTLAIINILGGTIGGIGVSTLAAVGTYGFIPFLNLMFILFLNVVQPKI